MATSMAMSTTKGIEGREFGKGLREREFLFDAKYRNLNHGSFGTYPRAIQKVMRAFQDQAEARPDHFIRYQYPKLLDQSREAIGKLLNAPTETLVFVPNATTGINTVLRNLVFEKGDHILYLSCIYGSCEKTVSYITETTPAEAVKIGFTFPMEDDWLVEEVKAKVKQVEQNGGKVKVAIFDTVVSMPGVRLPFERLVKVCRELGVLSCVDGAHGVGHIPIDLGSLDPDFFVSNCHKWLHIPRGCAIFHVALRNQQLIRSTLPTSHGFEPLPKPGEKIISPFRPSVGKSKWEYNFEFVGTIDNSPYLCIPAALKWREEHGGETAIMNYCIKLAQDAAKHYAEVLGTEVLDNSTGTLTNCPLINIRLPLSAPDIQALAVKAGMKKEEVGGAVRDWMVEMMIVEYDTFMAMIFHGDAWWVRLSGQVYLELSDFEWGAKVLKELCEKVKKGDFMGAKSRL